MTVSTPITTPFTAESTAAEVVNGIEAATSVLLATSPLLDGIGGRYFEDCNEAGRDRRAGAESRPTPWTPATPRCSGRSRWTRWPQPTWPEHTGLGAKRGPAPQTEAGPYGPPEGG